MLSQELLGHKASFVLSVETLCLELQMIADEFHEAGGSVSRFSARLCWLAYAVHAHDNIVGGMDEVSVVEWSPRKQVKESQEGSIIVIFDMLRGDANVAVS